MKRVIVIGCPGSGKSTFSRLLHEQTGIPLTHLDMLFWNKDKTRVEKSAFLERLSEVLHQDEWIIDGNFASTMELRMQHCDTVFFLDYSLDICLKGIQERKGKPRTDIPWVENEDDEEFLDFIKSFNEIQRPMILTLLDKYSDQHIVIFQNRAESDEFLKKLKENDI